ncbi:MAG: response regulator transcription factor [Bacteroidales bacterium]|nr:response regulator transcription factor [Bacteroidales bacterium]
MKELIVFLVDDHNLFREGLKQLLSRDAGIKSIYEASNGREFLDQLPGVQADIVLMDIEMPVLDGIRATREALEDFPDLKVLALSMYTDENYYSSMIEAGARGFLLKNSSFDQVKRAINDIAEGRSYFSPEIMDELIRNINRKKILKKETDLTDREIEILFHICTGLSNQEIADRLFLSKRTVDKHRENLLLKTGSKNTASLVIYAIKNGVIEI